MSIPSFLSTWLNTSDDDNIEVIDTKYPSKISEQANIQNHTSTETDLISPSNLFNKRHDVTTNPKTLVDEMLIIQRTNTLYEGQPCFPEKSKRIDGPDIKASLLDFPTGWKATTDRKKNSEKNRPPNKRRRRLETTPEREISKKCEIEPNDTGPNSDNIPAIPIQEHTDRHKSVRTGLICPVFYPNTVHKLYIGIFVRLGMALNIMLLSYTLS